MVSWHWVTPREIAMISSAAPASFRRIACSTAISSKGFMDILTFCVSTPVPSAFTRKTGEAHWHTLLRARAIENGCFVFAAAQAGLHENKRETFGHSLIVDPWGTVLADGSTEVGVVLASVDPAKVESARKSIPSLQHGRRFSVRDTQCSPEHLQLVRGSA